ncbi:hypothetical protein [Pseudocolwellia agarivorans]|uniref:hypothetical protein n=1 Tax=Pseudocolwellia agarivorans TaxID=1911682 RepID=UPI0009862B1D|nr:hypothetical protein [Pseudocolwellia agarivorans]
MPEKIISFELETDLLMALESLSSSLKKIKNGRESYLKWAFIFGHTALQSTMCLSLITTSSFLVRNKSFYQEDAGDLDNIEWLYQKLQKPEFLPYTGSKIIPKNELNQIKNIQKIRNTFIHQQPDLYIFTFKELFDFIILMVRLIRFLVSQSERMSFGGNVNKKCFEDWLDILEKQLRVSL